MAYFNQKYLIKTFKQRIRTQDRKDILPMKLISSYLGKSKEWKEFLTKYVLNIKFYIDSQGNVVPLKNVDSITIEDTGDVRIEYKNKIDNEMQAVPLYTKKLNMLCNTNKKNFEQLHVDYTKDIREITLDHHIPISILMDCLEFPFIRSFVEHLPNSNMKQNNNIVSKENLLSDIKKLFNLCDVYVVHLKDNLQKNNAFSLCDNVLTCQSSNVKKKIDEVKKLKSNV